MPFKEIIPVQSCLLDPCLNRESYRTHKYKMQIDLMVKAAGTYSYHSAFKG
jgi:hypothetical protein